MSSRRLGPYYLLEKLGQGAMGEVYRARDSKLGREVALKLLPRAFTHDSDRRSRFEREARMLAALTHPNIATIHGFEEGQLVGDDGIAANVPEFAIVMELVEGSTLAQRLETGALPLPTALDVARQIAAALDAAHEKGVIHRDLKPANIAITPTGVVKVLDFGLAKISEAVDSGSGAQTVIADRTHEGTVLGTFAYMSPEQARGETVDKRTDIWSFGCVLYELLTGRSAFGRATDTDTIAAFISREPDWNALPKATPPNVRHVLQRSLAKDRDRRLREIADARIELDEALGTLRSSRAIGAAPRAWIAAAGVVALVAAGVWLLAGRASAPVTSPSEYEQLTFLAESAIAPSLSPDGRMVTFKVGSDFFLSRGHIYVKLLPNGDSVRLTPDAAIRYGPVFTPDGSRIAYTQVGRTSQTLSWDTHVVPVLGGEPALFLPNASGLTWIDDRRVQFAEIASGLHMGIVATTESRTEKQDVYWPEHDLGMAHYAWASPNRSWVLVVEMDHSHSFRNPCRLVPFDGTSSGRIVGPDGTCTAASWSPDGRWMYFSANVDGSSHLWRQRFPDGAPEQITFGPTEEEGVAVTPDGRSLVTSLGMRQSSIWIREGTEERPLVSEGYSYAARLSADGTRVYYLLKQSSSAATATLRVLDVASGRTETVLSDAPVVDYDISRDETEVAYTTMDDTGESQVWHSSVDRRAPPRLIARNADQVSFGATRDLIFRSLEGSANTVVRASVDGGARPQRLEAPPVHNKSGVSPDGQWVIVQSPGAGHESTHTLAVPVYRPGPARTIGIGYTYATWSPDGRFFYVPVGAGGLSEPSGTLVFSVPEGHALPEIPAEIDRNSQYVEFPGAHVINQGRVAPGSDPSRYVFVRIDFHRNIFRIPIRG
jgi:Tol biopolymer transport system component/tRNA A-37 threonylcarbamoyl transferase component Bud32